jgi:deazaflavin-dependent oxidoreductase (nitroreductase family)
MARFDDDVVALIARQREVQLTTYGRKTGNPRRVTIWIGTDGQRLLIRSGQGFKRHWPQNLQKRPEGILNIGGKSLPFRAQLVTDPEEARRVTDLYRRKYGLFVRGSMKGEPLTPGEQTTFELVPLETTA